MKISEEEMSKNLVKWLQVQHWEVYQEVRVTGNGPIADIMAVRNGYLWAIECKTSFGFKVIEQAFRWRIHYRSIFVPETPNSNIDRNVLKDYYKLGLIVFRNYGHYKYQENKIEEVIQPKFMREFHSLSKLYISRLRPEQKTWANAGTNDQTKFYTPYKGTMLEVRKFIEKNPGCTLLDINKSVGKGHYHSNSSFKNSIRMALTNWESEWCETEIEGRTLRFYIRGTRDE